jgi:hypothetical protein
MLVSVNDLTTYMDIRFSLRQQDAAEIVLAGLQSELESFLRRPIEVQNFVEDYVIPSDYVGMPTSSFFYNTSLDTTMSPISYSQPPSTIGIRNSPIAKVNSVLIKNWSVSGQYMSEAMERTATVTAVSQAGPKVTYTANNHKFTIGQRVTIKSMIPTPYNVVAREIIEVTTNTFSVTDMPLSIDAMTQGGTATATGSDYVVRRYGIDLYRGFANDKVTIDYDAGINGSEIAIFKLLILRAAVREMQNMHDDVVGVKDLNTRNVAPLQTGFMDSELMTVKRYRRVRAA